MLSITAVLACLACTRNRRSLQLPSAEPLEERRPESEQSSPSRQFPAVASFLLAFNNLQNPGQVRLKRSVCCHPRGRIHPSLRMELNVLDDNFVGQQPLIGACGRHDRKLEAGVDAKQFRERSNPAHVVLLHLISRVFIASLISSSPVYADGGDEVARLCPDDRVTCVSSLDPYEGHFAEPWEYNDSTKASQEILKKRERVIKAVANEAARIGGQVNRDDSSSNGVALRVLFPDSDTAIFWFPEDDSLVQFRSERMDGSTWDFSRNKVRIEDMRKQLGYEKAALIRFDPEQSFLRSDGTLITQRTRVGPLSMFGSPGQFFKYFFPFNPLGYSLQSLFDDLGDLISILLGTKKIFVRR